MDILIKDNKLERLLDKLSSRTYSRVQDDRVTELKKILCDYSEIKLRLVGTGLDATVYSNPSLPWVIKIYHDTRDFRIPPENLIGKIFVDYYYANRSIGILIQEKVSVDKKLSYDKIADIHYCNEINGYKNIIDLHPENIGLNTKGEYRILDYGCYFEVKNYRNIDPSLN